MLQQTYVHQGSNNVLFHMRSISISHQFPYSHIDWLTCLLTGLTQPQPSLPKIQTGCQSICLRSPTLLRRYRGLNRTATLKYSGGALHDLKAAPSFDHTYDSAAVKATPPPPIITAVSAKAGTEGGGCVVLPALQSSPLNGPTCSKDSSPGTAGKTAGSAPGSTGKMGSSLSTVTGSSSSPGSASSSPCLTRSTNVTPTRGLSPRPCLPEQVPDLKTAGGLFFSADFPQIFRKNLRIRF